MIRLCLAPGCLSWHKFDFVALFYLCRSGKGLNYSPPETDAQRFVLIEFHCLVPICEWIFDEDSKVYIRFGSSVLGAFNDCHGPMETKWLVRYVVLML